MPKSERLTRRDVMTATTLTGLSAAVAGGARLEAADPPPEQDDPRAVRFVETEHVRTYYSLARS